MKIFGKINGHYMFPESHSHAFAITAYQAAWLKAYHPLEFFVSLMNNQPMGSILSRRSSRTRGASACRS